MVSEHDNGLSANRGQFKHPRSFGRTKTFLREVEQWESTND
jgi:hypothetical protein